MAGAVGIAAAHAAEVDGGIVVVGEGAADSIPNDSALVIVGGNNGTGVEAILYGAAAEVAQDAAVILAVALAVAADCGGADAADNRGGTAIAARDAAVAMGIVMSCFDSDIALHATVLDGAIVVAHDATDVVIASEGAVGEDDVFYDAARADLAEDADVAVGIVIARTIDGDATDLFVMAVIGALEIEIFGACAVSDGGIGVVADDIRCLEEGETVAVVVAVVHIVGQVAQVILVLDVIGVRAGGLKDAESRHVGVGEGDLAERGLRIVCLREVPFAVVVGVNIAGAGVGLLHAVLKTAFQSRHHDVGDVVVGVRARDGVGDGLVAGSGEDAIIIEPDIAACAPLECHAEPVGQRDGETTAATGGLSDGATGDVGRVGGRRRCVEGGITRTGENDVVTIKARVLLGTRDLVGHGFRCGLCVLSQPHCDEQQ